MPKPDNFQLQNATPSAGATWWMNASQSQKTKLMREMGFGDYRVYAAYRWQDFAPHTRVEIERIVSSG